MNGPSNGRGKMDDKCRHDSGDDSCRQEGTITIEIGQAGHDTAAGISYKIRHDAAFCALPLAGNTGHDGQKQVSN
jgi:hypothetical protein